MPVAVKGIEIHLIKIRSLRISKVLFGSEAESPRSCPFFIYSMNCSSRSSCGTDCDRGFDGVRFLEGPAACGFVERQWLSGPMHSGGLRPLASRARLFALFSLIFQAALVVCLAYSHLLLRFSLGLVDVFLDILACLLYTSPSPRDKRQSRMPSSA